MVYVRLNLRFFCVISWAIWTSRNQLLHQNVSRSAAEILEMAGRVLYGYQQCGEREDAHQDSRPLRDEIWRAPETCRLKLNTDASVRSHQDYIGVGAVVRDAEGVVWACLAKKLPGSFSSFIAECIALREGLVFARQCGLDVHDIEVDVSRVAQVVNGGATLGEEGAVIEDILSLLSTVGNWKVSLCREANVVAHILASYVYRVDCDICGIDRIPNFVAQDDLV